MHTCDENPSEECTLVNKKTFQYFFFRKSWEQSCVLYSNYVSSALQSSLCIQQSENKNFFFPLDRSRSLILTIMFHCERQKGVKCIFIWLSFLALLPMRWRKIYCRESFKLIEFKLFLCWRNGITAMTSPYTTLKCYDEWFDYDLKINFF